jgi:hypothetical protein
MRKRENRKAQKGTILFFCTLMFMSMFCGCSGLGKKTLSEKDFKREAVEGKDYEIIPAEEPGWNWYVNHFLGYRIKILEGMKFRELRAFKDYVYVNPKVWSVSFDGPAWFEHTGIDCYLREDEAFWGEKVKVTPFFLLEDKYSGFPGKEGVTYHNYTGKHDGVYYSYKWEVENFTFKGYPATRMIASEKRNGEHWCKWLALSFVTDDMVFFIERDSHGAEGTFEKRLPDIEKMLNSFELI